MIYVFETDDKNENIKFFGGSWSELPSIKIIDSMIEKLNKIKNKGNNFINDHNENIKRFDLSDIKKDKENEDESPRSFWSGYIYIIKSGNLYKIGKSKDPKNRIKAIKISNPQLETIIYEKVFNYNTIEKHLHNSYKSRRRQGEWFELNNIDINNIIQKLNKCKYKEE